MKKNRPVTADAAQKAQACVMYWALHTGVPVVGRYRLPYSVCVQIGESLESLSDLERVLRITSTHAHERIADVLWDASSDQDALSGLQKIANEHLLQWETAPDGIIDDSRLEALASG